MTASSLSVLHPDSVTCDASSLQVTMLELDKVSVAAELAAKGDGVNRHIGLDVQEPEVEGAAGVRRCSPGLLSCHATRISFFAHQPNFRLSAALWQACCTTTAPALYWPPAYF